jgi:hypothetical protein
VRCKSGVEGRKERAERAGQPRFCITFRRRKEERQTNAHSAASSPSHRVSLRRPPLPNGFPSRSSPLRGFPALDQVLLFLQESSLQGAVSTSRSRRTRSSISAACSDGPAPPSRRSQVREAAFLGGKTGLVSAGSTVVLRSIFPEVLSVRCYSVRLFAKCTR